MHVCGVQRWLPVYCCRVRIWAGAREGAGGCLVDLLVHTSALHLLALGDVLPKAVGWGVCCGAAVGPVRGLEIAFFSCC